MYLFQLYFSQGICPVLGLLSHMVVLFLAFKGISILFSIVAGSICISTNSARGFPFLHTLSLSLIVCRFFDDGCSDWCAVISHCNFKIIWENSVCLFSVGNLKESSCFLPFVGLFFGLQRWKLLVRDRALWIEGVATGEWQYSTR